MSEPVKILPHYTYEDWVNWEGQWELIDGIPHAMSPMPVPKHQQIANALGGEFYLALKACNNCKTFQAIDYKIQDDTILQPDILVICDVVNKKYLDFPPALIVEISSPSTALKDRHSKFQIYEKQQIEYYIIISPDEEDAEVCQFEEGAYHLKDSGRNFTYVFSFDIDCKAAINFKEIW